MLQTPCCLISVTPKGKVPNCSAFSIDPRHRAVDPRPNDLKHHGNVFGGGDLGHGVEGSGASLDNQEAGHASR